MDTKLEFPNCYATVQNSTYFNSLDTTVDRMKPFNTLHLFQWDNKCSALDADWQCLPYALERCEGLRGEDAYLQCAEDHFQACRKGAGCDYRATILPEMCDGVTTPARVQHNVSLVCNSPEKEYASQQSYDACVNRMDDWVGAGCGNIAQF